MPESFTHTFEFKVGDEELKGKIKFDTGKQPIISIDEPVKSLEMNQAAAFSNCMQHLGRLFEAFGSIDSVEINTITP